MRVRDNFAQVSQVWFSESERMFTTAAMAGAAAFGAMIGERAKMIDFANLFSF